MVVFNSHLDLRQTPKQLFTLISRYGKSSSLTSLADQMVASGTNFLTGVIIARNCSQDEFGLYMLCFSIIIFALDLQTSLISAPYMVYNQKLTGTRHAAYLGNTLLQQALLFGAILLVLVAGIQLTGYYFEPKGVKSVLFPLSVVLWPIMLRECIRRICFAGLQMATALLVDCIVMVSQITILLFLAFQDNLSAGNAFYSIGFSCTLSCLFWFVSHRGRYIFNLDTIKEDLKKNLSFGKWIFASSLLWAVSMTLYPWLLAFFHGTAATGIWGACIGVIAIANPLMLGIQNYLAPKIVQSYIKEGREALSAFVVRTSILCGIILIPLAIILLSMGGELVSLLYGKQYSGNSLVVSILAINLLVTAITFPVSRGLLAMERVRLYFMANVVPFMVMLVCGIFLVKHFAVTGVAMALLAGSVSTAVTLTAFFTGSGTRKHGTGTYG